MQGAAAMPPDLLRRWFDLLSPEQIVMAYGMTENLGLATLRGDEWLQHPGTVGRALLGESQGGVLCFLRRSELLVVHDVLDVPRIVEDEPPVILPALHYQFDVIVLCFVAVSDRHESQYMRTRR